MGAVVDKIQYESLFFVYFGGAGAGFRCGSRQNSLESRCFCLLLGPREPDLESAVDKIRWKSPFFVYFGVRRRWIWPGE